MNTDIRLPSNSLPKERYIYLVNDTSDVQRIGLNAYTTFQTAYAAAVTLQTTLGGTNKVVIMIGVTTAAVVGDLILTATWNNNVILQGISQISSVVGNIDASNASGAGVNIGSSVGTNMFRAYNLTIGNIITSATGPTGNSGRFHCVCSNVKIGNINTDITDISNITGNGGSVRIQAVGLDGGVAINIANITTSSQDANSTAGSCFIYASIYSIANIITANNNKGGAVILLSTLAYGGNVANITSISTNNFGGTITKWENVRVGIVTQEASGATGNWIFTAIDCAIGVFGVINNDGTNKGTYTFNGCRLEQYQSNDDIITLMQNCGLEFIDFLGSNSKLYNVSIIQVNASDPCIKGIGSDCYLYNCSLVKESAGDCMSNFSNPVTVKYYNSTFSSSIDSAIILIEDNGVPQLTDAGGGAFTLDGVVNKSAFVILTGGTAGVNTLDLDKLIDGKRYKVMVSNSTGSDTLLFNSLIGSTIVIEGGTYVPTAILDAIDQLEIEYDSVTDYVFVSPKYNFS